MLYQPRSFLERISTTVIHTSEAGTRLQTRLLQNLFSKSKNGKEVYL